MGSGFLFNLLGVSNFKETEHKRNVVLLVGVEKKEIGMKYFSNFFSNFTSVFKDCYSCDTP